MIRMGEPQITLLASVHPKKLTAPPWDHSPLPKYVCVISIFYAHILRIKEGKEEGQENSLASLALDVFKGNCCI
eukprot:1157619-Pelagomonas_calceolata.AAC.24